MLMNYKDIVITAARTVDIGVVDVEVNEYGNDSKFWEAHWRDIWEKAQTERRD